MSNNQPTEPEGISFFNVKSGETHYAKLEPTIAAYINSSDMGINASRGQDYGWKLGANWVKRVKEFRRDAMQMRILQANNNGQKPTTTQILYYLYGEDMRAFQEQQDENEAPFLEQYQRDTADEGQAPTVAAPASLPEASEDEDDITDLIDEVITEDEPVSSTNGGDVKVTDNPKTTNEVTPGTPKVGRPAKQK